MPDESFDPQSMPSEKKDAEEDPYSEPAILNAMELFPEMEAEALLQVYIDCGRNKEIMIETLLMGGPGVMATQPKQTKQPRKVQAEEPSCDSEEALEDLFGITQSRVEQE